MGQCASALEPSWEAGAGASSAPEEAAGPDATGADDPSGMPLAADVLALDVPLLSTDAEGVVLHVNDAGVDFFCCHALEDLVGRRMQDLVLPQPPQIPSQLQKHGSARSGHAGFSSSNRFRAFPNSHTPQSSWYSPPTSAANHPEGPASAHASPARRKEHFDMQQRAAAGSMKAYLPLQGSGSPWVAGSARTRGAGGSEVIPVLMAVTATPHGFSAVLQDLGSTQTAREDAVSTHRIEQTRDDRSRFIAYLSHEIRVPMNALSLGIGLLAQHDVRELRPTASPEEDLVGLKEHCDDLSGCCDAVLHLLKDVLDMEQMQNGLYRYSFGPADMVALAVRAESIARMGLQRSKGVTFQQSLAPQVLQYRVWCDGHRLQQAVGNFMSNAVRHADAGGRVRLTIAWKWREEKKKNSSSRHNHGNNNNDSNSGSSSGGNDTAGASSDSGTAGGSGGGTGAVVTIRDCDNGGKAAADAQEGVEDATQVEEEEYDDEEADARAFLSAPEHARPVDLTIQVWNSGSYLHPGSEEAIFRPYVTLGDGDNEHDESARRTGIGLSITREIICSGHRGSVRAWSDGTGTTFSATLRVFAVPADPRANAAAAAAAKQKRLDRAVVPEPLRVPGGAGGGDDGGNADVGSAAGSAEAGAAAVADAVEAHAKKATTGSGSGSPESGLELQEVATSAAPAEDGATTAAADEAPAAGGGTGAVSGTGTEQQTVPWHGGGDTQHAAAGGAGNGGAGNGEGEGEEAEGAAGQQQAPPSYPIEVDEGAVDVLYIEDSRLNRKMLQRTLQRMGTTCELAEDGREGVEWLEERGRGCRLVLVDRSMPVMDGLEATRRIKQLFPDVPVVGLTGDAQPHEIASFLAAGADDVLTKPVAKDDLAATLRRFLG